MKLKYQGSLSRMVYNLLKKAVMEKIFPQRDFFRNTAVCVKLVFKHLGSKMQSCGCLYPWAINLRINNTDFSWGLQNKLMAAVSKEVCIKKVP